MAGRSGMGVTGLAALFGLVLAVLSACSPVVRGHGYAPKPEELSRIQPGVDDKASVRSKIGRPGGTGIANDDAWYYVATTIEEFAYRAPAVTDRRVVAVLFTEAGIVADVRQFGLEDGRVVDLVTRTTPTYGRELTVVQQLFGNILNFTPGALLQ